MCDSRSQSAQIGKKSHQSVHPASASRARSHAQTCTSTSQASAAHARTMRDWTGQSRPRLCFFSLPTQSLHLPLPHPPPRHTHSHFHSHSHFTLTLTPTPTPTPHPHTSRLHCLFSSHSPSPSPSVSCDVVGDSHRRSFYGPGRPPNHLSYTHLLSPQPSGTAHHLSPSDVTPVLHMATLPTIATTTTTMTTITTTTTTTTNTNTTTTLSFQIPTRLGVGGQARQPPCYRCYCCHYWCCACVRFHVALPIVSYHDCTDR